ncbi:glutamate-rich protein 5 isoform X1 [Zootoca vivipara]|uniref:glutamate-rich protein 5 isoform X1 n=1 Tax=Zootoca vivipara TaxID=8524 RepID=UPI00293BD7CF|nr:glutamate-rich protein 5 isoform X1 [Zootoca vivipara]
MRGKFLGTRSSAGGGGRFPPLFSAWERRHLRAFPSAAAEREVRFPRRSRPGRRPVSLPRARCGEWGPAAQMGCSSSAQTQVKDCSRPAPMSPDANGLLKCEDNLPIAVENESVSDQTKLGAMEEVELGSDGAKLSKGVAEEEADVLIPGMTNCALSTCQRVDPEGTEPQPVAPEEKFSNSLPVALLEAGEPRPAKPAEEVGEPQAATETANTLPLETIEDSQLDPVESAETDTAEPATDEIVRSLVTEIVKELQVDEEQQTEGETGEKEETEMHRVAVSEGFETKEEEMGEATAATEIEATNNEE